MWDDFGTNSVDSLKFWLPKFVAEVRKIDGTCNSLYQICCGLQRSPPKFVAFRDTLDSVMKELKATGKFQPCKAEPISENVEDILWSEGLARNRKTPIALRYHGILYPAVLCIEER